MNKTKETLALKLEAEREAFRTKIAEISPLGVYDMWYKIHFFESYYELLMSDYVDDHGEIITWLNCYNQPLALLYDEWLRYDAHFSDTWEDMIGWLSEVFESDVVPLTQDDLLEGKTNGKLIKIDKSALEDGYINHCAIIYFTDAVTPIVARYERVTEDKDSIDMKRIENGNC